jgi:replicative DNA helicase
MFEPPVETTTFSVPHSREAEEAVIGSILIAPDLFPVLGLTSAHFYIRRLGMIWDAYTRLEQKKLPIDALTVVEELDDMGRLEEIGGPAYLTALLNQVPTTLHAEGYAEIIKAQALRRALLVAANEMARMAYDTSLDANDLLVQAESNLRKVGLGSEQKIRPSREIAGEIYDEMLERGKQLASGQPLVFDSIATGLTDVDKLLDGGLQPERLYIIAGRPGQGKTSWLISTIRHQVVKLGKRVAVFSLEMPRKQLMRRFLAQEAEINASKLTNGVLGPEDWEPFVQAVGRMGNSRLYLDDTPSLTPASLRAKCHQLERNEGLDLVVVDYLQLMGAGGGMRFQNREQEVAHCSRELKLLARELGIPVLAAAQLSRAAEVRADHEPQLSDLRESGAIENDADAVAFIWRPDQSVSISRFKVGKNRDGQTGCADLLFNAPLTRFESVVTRTIDLNA